MASVIGLLFFVVLLMAVDMVNSQPASPSGAAPDQRVQKIQKQLEEHAAELEAMKQAVSRSSEKITLVMKDDTEIAKSIQDLNKRLSPLLETLKQREQITVEIQKRLPRQKEQIDKLKSQIALLNTKVKQETRQLADSARTPRLSYIIGKRSDNLEPWLVDLSDKRILVGSKDGAKTVIGFQAGSADARTEQFLTWAKTQSPQRSYFVLLIRPSAVDLLKAITPRLMKSGFQIGTDLLPEDWKVLE
jgi:peptidoglycan hydrolase CwlO-like protein